MICLESIRPQDPVWSCQGGCYAVMHLPCIQVGLSAGSVACMRLQHAVGRQRGAGGARSVGGRRARPSCARPLPHRHIQCLQPASRAPPTQRTHPPPRCANCRLGHVARWQPRRPSPCRTRWWTPRGRQLQRPAAPPAGAAPSAGGQAGRVRAEGGCGWVGVWGGGRGAPSRSAWSGLLWVSQTHSSGGCVTTKAARIQPNLRASRRRRPAHQLCHTAQRPGRHITSRRGVPRPPGRHAALVPSLPAHPLLSRRVPCRQEYAAVPSGYSCWCGKVPDPEWNPWNAAHRWGPRLGRGRGGALWLPQAWARPGCGRCRLSRDAGHWAR